MTRVAICGPELAPAAETLGLEIVADRPDVVLLDLADPEAIVRAGEIDPVVPRIVAPSRDQEPLLRALGSGPFLVAASRSCSAIGPLIAKAAPQSARRPTRVIAITGTAGGCGRTLLTVNLAVRLATRSVIVVDLTGSGSAAMRLGLEAPSWSELEGLVAELTPEQIAVIAAERDGVRVAGGAGAMPSAALAVAAVRAAAGIAELVIVDAPVLPDERALAVCATAERVLLVVPDGASVPAVPSFGEAWIIASRALVDRLGGREAFHSLPDDPRSVRAATRDGAFVGGRLGRAYDELAEVIAIDTAGS